MVAFFRLHLIQQVMLCWWLARCQSWPTAVGDFDRAVAEAEANHRVRRHELNGGHDHGHHHHHHVHETASTGTDDGSEASSLSELREPAETATKQGFPMAEFAVGMSERPDRVNLETTSQGTTTTTQRVTVVEQDAEILPEEGTSGSTTSASPIDDAVTSTEQSTGFLVTDNEWEELRQKLHLTIDGILSETLTDDLRGRIKRVLDEVIRDYREEDHLHDSDEDHHGHDDDDEPKHPFVHIHNKAHKKVYKIDLVLGDMLKVQRAIHSVFDIYPY